MGGNTTVINRLKFINTWKEDLNGMAAASMTQPYDCGEDAESGLPSDSPTRMDCKHSASKHLNLY